MRHEGRRLRVDEYPEARRGTLVVESWQENNFNRFIRRMTLREQVGLSARSGPVLVDPVPVPGPLGGLLFAGTELIARDGRVHEMGQLWFVRPMISLDELLPPFNWERAASRLPQP